MKDFKELKEYITLLQLKDSKNRQLFTKEFTNGTNKTFLNTCDFRYLYFM